jgi:hypothetical protein
MRTVNISIRRNLLQVALKVYFDTGGIPYAAL